INAQALLKHILTESDKLVLSYFSLSLAAQGGYAIAANYGSLVARLVLQPIEESLRLFFSGILAPPPPSSSSQSPAAFLQGTNAAELLQVWVWCLPVLSLNGGLEAFVAVTAETGDLARQSFFMFTFSILYLSSALVFYSYFELGDASLIYANIVNLLARISFCLFF
ncbi:hypothetical protein PLEOSDRAFT_1025211, partial [Pleurotus ostreatus PC15]